MRRSVFACACLVLIAAASAAQVAPLPPRDRPLAPAAPAGTGAIKGRVVDGQTGNAVVRARVRLMGSGPRQPVVLTDESGAFAFAALPRGSYSVMVDKATYVSGRYPDGGQTFRTSARPIELADGQRVDGITVTIFRGGVIAGHVVDAHGDPVEGASVQAVRLPRTGRGRPQTRTSGSTNDIGEFRLPHLEPGKYLIQIGRASCRERGRKCEV